MVVTADERYLNHAGHAYIPPPDKAESVRLRQISFQNHRKAYAQI